ncbi:MAG: hypothetical protein R6U40_08050 [Desulfobacterales bacterium]
MCRWKGIWAVAREADVKLLISENFQDERELDGLRFCDPFIPGRACQGDIRLMSGAFKFLSIRTHICECGYWANRGHAAAIRLDIKVCNP